MARPVQLDQAWTYLRAGDVDGALRVIEPAHTSEPCAETFEALARARYLQMEFAAAIELWEQAYAAYRADDAAVAAVRVARTLGAMYGTVVGDGAVCAGWISRATTLLGNADGSAEAGWVSLTKGMFEPDRARKEELFRDALDVGRRLGDGDLEFAALAYLGASIVHDDRIEEGMRLLDEALAAIAGAEVDDFCVVEEIFCQLFSACEHAHDVARADQWIRVGEAIAERRKLPAVSAFCHTHYGAVLTAAGRWSEAETALIDAVRNWGLGQRSGLRRGALVRLADLRVRQGRFEEAEELLTGLDAEADADVARPLVALHLARGRTALARDVLARALPSVGRMSIGAAPLLALQVEADLASGRLDDARAAADDLAACAAAHPRHPYVAATAALAQGRVCVASGEGDPQACLREALAGFARAQMPVDAARSRMALATAVAPHDPEVALAEAQAALDALNGLEVSRDADEAAAFIRSLGARPAGGPRSAEVLTRREAEVLDLLGHGLSNPEISDRLFISRKTVEHHVGNVLSKLGLRSRAEAAAFATRARSAAK